ncbi:RidA family protein [Vitreimonas sp.]|uniref:RidA family protein n=1 Tax=Vitreimonas sp. TaxID=3069702 RepID=UPI002ED8F16F
MRLSLLIAALFLLPGCVTATVTATPGEALRETIIPTNQRRAYDEYHYAPAVRAGDYVFLSGIVAGMGPGETDAEAGYDRAFRAVAATLREADAEWADVVEMTTYHTDLPAQFETFSRVKDRYVPEPYPAWTAIDVDRLLPDGGLVEIRVIAYAPRD